MTPHDLSLGLEVAVHGEFMSAVRLDTRAADRANSHPNASFYSRNGIIPRPKPRPWPMPIIGSTTSSAAFFCSSSSTA